MLFPEEVVSSCLKEISPTHSFPSVAFKRKTVTFKVTARKKKGSFKPLSLPVPVISNNLEEAEGVSGEIIREKKAKISKGIKLTPSLIAPILNSDVAGVSECLKTTPECSMWSLEA